MKNRDLKDLLYEQVARIGKAVSSPKRLEILELLAQSEKSVESLAEELAIDIKLASAHLRTLREARLVTSRKDGKFVIYRLTGLDVASLWVNLRQVAEDHLVELRVALNQMVAEPSSLVKFDRETLLKRVKRGDVLLLDLRPQLEYEQAHLPFARSMPFDEISDRLAELPKDIEIVAYCRGPFCLFSEDAYRLLRDKGFRVSKLLDGVSEWNTAGMPLAID